jgi:ATP-dependent protease ClpP protease subunit
MLLSSRNPKSIVGNKPCFRASLTTSGEFEILIYEEIGEYFDRGTSSMAGITVKSVRQSLDQAGVFSRIKLRINSPGGDAFEGVAIGNVLKAAGRPIDVCIDGIAASAASIIAMCGGTITMASNAMMMIHKAWSACIGNCDDMRKMAETLDSIDSGAIAQTYVDKTGRSMAEILAMMAEETWLSARECLDMGFATAIASEANESAVAMARNFKALAKMKRVPASLQRTMHRHSASTSSCECDCQECEAGDCANCSNEVCRDKNCTDCPMQSTASNLSLYLATQQLLEKGILRA